jgi:hypothetical protein
MRIFFHEFFGLSRFEMIAQGPLWTSAPWQGSTGADFVPATLPAGSWRRDSGAAAKPKTVPVPKDGLNIDASSRWGIDRRFPFVDQQKQGAAMKTRGRTKGIFRCGFAILTIGAVLLFFACDQQGGTPIDLSKKAPPNLGAISGVDGSGEEKADTQKPQTEAEKKPEQGSAGGSQAQPAPKQ